MIISSLSDLALCITLASIAALGGYTEATQTLHIQRSIHTFIQHHYSPKPCTTTSRSESGELLLACEVTASLNRVAISHAK